MGSIRRLEAQGLRNAVDLHHRCRGRWRAHVRDQHGRRSSGRQAAGGHVLPARHFAESAARTTAGPPVTLPTASPCSTRPRSQPCITRGCSRQGRCRNLRTRYTENRRVSRQREQTSPRVEGESEAPIQTPTWGLPRQRSSRVRKFRRRTPVLQRTVRRLDSRIFQRRTAC